MKLNHFVAQSGLASRRNAALMIKEGLISVNHFVQKNPAYEVQPKDTIRYKKEILTVSQEKIYVLINKPIGYVSTTTDEHNRPTVLDLLPQQLTAQARLFPVGRLDYDTSGLILLTNDGSLAHTLAHPRYEIRKKYIVHVDKALQIDDLKSFCNGVQLSDGRAHIDHFTLHPNKANVVTVAIHSGKKHIIRRLFESRGYMVEKLERVTFGPFTTYGIAPGSYKMIAPTVLEKLMHKGNPAHTSKINAKNTLDRQL